VAIGKISIDTTHRALFVVFEYIFVCVLSVFSLISYFMKAPVVPCTVLLFEDYASADFNGLQFDNSVTQMVDLKSL